VPAFGEEGCVNLFEGPFEGCRVDGAVWKSVPVIPGKERGRRGEGEGEEEDC
jgi:hypothetical protein